MIFGVCCRRATAGLYEFEGSRSSHERVLILLRMASAVLKEMSSLHSGYPLAQWRVLSETGSRASTQLRRFETYRYSNGLLTIHGDSSCIVRKMRSYNGFVHSVAWLGVACMTLLLDSKARVRYP